MVHMIFGSRSEEKHGKRASRCVDIDLLFVMGVQGASPESSRRLTGGSRLCLRVPDSTSELKVALHPKNTRGV